MPFVDDDQPDAPASVRRPYDDSIATDRDVVVYRITGAFFFGAAASIGSVLDRISATHRALAVDFAAVPFIDATAANTLEGLARKAGRQHVRVVLTGTTHEVREELFVHGVRPPLVRYERSIEAALAKRHRALSPAPHEARERAPS